jgi:hypothetical protein
VKLRLNPRMVRFAQAVTLIGCILIGSTGCVVVDEFNRQPFDIDPPAQLWELMHTEHVDEHGRDWISRCLDHGGQPVLLDGVALCSNRDY